MPTRWVARLLAAGLVAVGTVVPAGPVASARPDPDWRPVTGPVLSGIARSMHRSLSFTSDVRCYSGSSLAGQPDRVLVSQSRWAIRHWRACGWGDGWGWSVVSSAAPASGRWVVEFTAGTGAESCADVAASVPSASFVATLRADVTCV